MTDFELDSTIEQIAREARRGVAISRDARDRGLEAVRAEPLPLHSTGGWRSFFAPRAVVVAPSRVAVLAAGLVGIGVVLGVGSRFDQNGREAGPPEASAVASPRISASDTVFTFVVIAPGAGRVSVVGDFNQWSSGANPMTRIENSNAWSVTVRMPAGRHLYSFFTVGKDGGQWLGDPNAPAAPRAWFDPPHPLTIPLTRSIPSNTPHSS